MKNYLIIISCFTSAALFTLSCRDEKTFESNGNVKPEFNYDDWLDSLLIEEEKILKDTLQSPYHFRKGSEYLFQYTQGETQEDTSNLLVLARDSYEKGVKIGTDEPFAVFYCGLLTEKTGDKEEAKNYYLLAFELAKENLLKVDEYVNSEFGEVQLDTAREKDSLYNIIASNYKDKQKLSIGLSQIMLGNKELGLNNIKSVERDNPQAMMPMKLFGSYYTREDILNWMNFE